MAEPLATRSNRDGWVRALERPHERLMWLYLLRSLAVGPFFPLALLVLFFKYHTLRYRFDDEGVSVSYGVLFRQESLLGYVKIQDIHVHRGFVERWLGLATVQIQTAAGSSNAEVTIEGVQDHDAVRDFLYRRMRGHEHDADGAPDASPAGAGAASAVAASAASAGASEAEALGLLRDLREQLVATRAALEARR